MRLVSIFLYFIILIATPAINAKYVINNKNLHKKQVSSKKNNNTLKNLTDDEIDAISRVALAEAGNQGINGLIAVVFIIINRYKDGRFGQSITEVINQKWAFEPVSKAGGWHKLPVTSKKSKNEINDIIQLINQGYLSDITNGSLYFQNPKIIEKRIKEKKTTEEKLHFNNSSPSAIIGDHFFYKSINSKNKIRKYKKIKTINQQSTVIFNKK